MPTTSTLALVKTLRPHQWVKNVFVAAPLVFARHLGDSSFVVRTAIEVLAFSLLSGAVYAFNDVRDVAQDRAHPIKRKRPIASGVVSERAALATAVVLAIVALGASSALSLGAGAFAGIYLVQNVAYSLKLKQIAFLDVSLIASGFLLRVLAGAAAIDVPPSKWLLLCTGLLALLLGLGKRAHELAWAGTQRGRETRAALQGYRLPVVRVAMAVLAIVTAAAYVAYAVAPRTVAEFGTDRLVYSAPFVVLGIVRFLMLSLWFPKDDPPTEAMLKDPWFLLDLGAAAAVVLYIIYW